MCDSHTKGFVRQRWGNIAEVDWATANDGILRRYGYVYDDLNRLRAGYYQNSQNPSAKTASV
ncbi:hypothetical protein [Chryseobacterium sp. MDT2-18]|uniref:hypothetical protein n=1 Tax=Chryseobacterium sp. MDT2-18 TaxID=1259136 RepID=UPI00278850DA|nr:hypothetical protein [Chryseobacterium sp. MDT2-18]MDQ0476706.1 hypothetical protein [Chryseobacterium sp. MDT2-18]